MLKLNVIFYSVLLACFATSTATADESNSFDLSLQELLNVEVTSVSKQKQPLSNSPAAIYVITSEHIRNSGATSIPQVLRDVPGLHVGQIDSQKWAISSRGFNGRYNNKLLVLMDGRTLYSPIFSGVYWEVQDTLMADIERIEVIRGPSAAMWGANAVNGVINIITKHSADTSGGYAELGAGDYEQGFAGFRYGSTLSDNATSRVYVKGHSRDSLEYNSQDLDSGLAEQLATVDKDNDWMHLQVGGRVDMELDTGTSLMLSSDVYRTEMQQTSYYPSLVGPSYRDFNSNDINSDGFNLLSKLTKALSPTSQYSLQAYYDYAKRDDDWYGFSSETVDVDFQHQLLVGQNHNIIWGLGYRFIQDDFDQSTIIVSSESESTRTNLWSAFIRDEITLVDDELWLTLASRFEHYDYTGFEVQPNARLMWQLNKKNNLWASVARAIRTPSRIENNLSVNSQIIPPSVQSPLVSIWVAGNEDYKSEVIISYEVGYRFTPAKKWSFDSTIFYNDYDQLRNAPAGATDFSTFPNYISQYLTFSNDLDGYNYGFELSSQWAATDTIQFKVNYSFTQNEFGASQSQNTDAPEHMISTMMDWSISDNVDFNLVWRVIDEAYVLNINDLSTKEIDSYSGVDLGLHWKVKPDVMLSAFGKNLLHPANLEFEGESYQLPYRVGPSYYIKATLTF
ncbi:TonB-dependent receptor plug domain-containing protein [Shewanella frigidimarina]|uniref:TonB-dependent receptor, plug n=2 Tax=Shewanella TaxID=22 RepID=Q07VX9_SHEFN|nr:TonB-dependent receptor [Shewanella frigidimarina]ABI73835.1 TonB-dependent receptor, plug [Shewanella frigidimarina NCIMB 400]